MIWVLISRNITVRIWLVVLLVGRRAGVELLGPVAVLGRHVPVIVVFVLRVSVRALDCVLVVKLFGTVPVCANVFCW